jgi:hypothetical protein
VIIERKRENVFTITATRQEVAALVAGARMALDVMRSAPSVASQDAVKVLSAVLGDFDRARDRLAGTDE